MVLLFQREDGKELASAEVAAGPRRQRLVVALRGDDATLLLSEGGARLRSWPLHAVKLTADQPVKVSGGKEENSTQRKWLLLEQSLTGPL